MILRPAATAAQDNPTKSTDAEDALQRIFGVERFRPGRREALDALLAGRDALVILSNGTGELLVYQLTALLPPGTALVVSPLIALMRDQAQALRAAGFPGTAALNSQIPCKQHEALGDLAAGRLRLLYVAPERCATKEFRRTAGATPTSLFARDLLDEVPVGAAFAGDRRTSSPSLSRYDDDELE